MISHYLKTTFRYLSENKGFSIINLCGLAIALCIVYLTFFYIRFELSYDRFHTNGERIYRVSTDIEYTSGTTQETSAAPLAGALLQHFPEVENAARLYLDYFIISKGQENFGEETLFYADSAMFDVFSFPLLRGNKSTVFDAPFNLVISETAAIKYFGTTDCLNQTLLLSGTVTATVTGIMKDIPSNSHIQTDMLLSVSSLFSFPANRNRQENWQQFGFLTYVLLKDNMAIAPFQQKLNAFAHSLPLTDQQQYSFVIEPLKDLYHHGSTRGNKAGTTVSGNYTNIYIFAFVAFFVLCIACFNYINLTTALSIKRAKEIGVRQVMGATTRQLAVQFFTDALVLSILGFLASVVLSAIAIPWFNELAGKAIIDNFSIYLAYLPYALAIALSTGVLAGIYPAIFLSRFKPITTLKGKFSGSNHGMVLRRSLVITQFVIYTLLTVATLVIYRQVHFMRNTQLGFEKAHNIAIDFHYDTRIRNHQEHVKQLLTEIPGVTAASFSAYIPGKPNREFPTSIEGSNGTMEEIQSDAYFIDSDFLHQYGIQVVAGRGFSAAVSDDIRTRMLVNEAYVKQLGYSNPQDIIGKRFSQLGSTGEIIGVVKNFHFQSMREEIQPLAMQIAPGFFTFLTLSISPGNIPATLEAIEQKWHDIAPGLPLIYSFTDETFDAQYQAEERFGKLFVTFAGCSIFISCLGLLGLVSFNTLQRTKEVGVRKVLGASVFQVIILLTHEYIRLVAIAFLLAVPLAWVVMHQWLVNFAYRIQIQWWMFLLTGISAVLIAILTIGLLAIRAARANPVIALRNE